MKHDLLLSLFVGIMKDWDPAHPWLISQSEAMSSLSLGNCTKGYLLGILELAIGSLDSKAADYLQEQSQRVVLP